MDSKKIIKYAVCLVDYSYLLVKVTKVFKYFVFRQPFILKFYFYLFAQN